MWIVVCFGLVALVGASRDKIGYFWHVTDIHYDVHNRRGCGSWGDYDRNGGSSWPQKLQLQQQTNRFGDYGCDSSWELIKSAARLMKSHQDVDFVLWTGDAMSHESSKETPETTHLNVLKNLTHLLESTFVYHSIYPALGHDDPHSKKRVAELWRKWLPFDDKTKPFEKGGYYLIEQKSKVPLLLVLNTNLMRNEDKKESAEEQWVWIEKALKKMKQNGEKVYLVGHIPPGASERSRGGNPLRHAAYTDNHNKRYLNVTREYSDTIVGQFFGHLHSDTFRVIYDTKGQPISWALISPSVSPRLQNNPALRLYMYSRDTGQVLDYTQYFLNLTEVNSALDGDDLQVFWRVEYVFSERYGLTSLSPAGLHELAEKLSQLKPKGNPVFKLYYQANFVGNNPPLTSCDSNCVRSHYCAITRVDYTEHELCVKTAASAYSTAHHLRAGSALIALIAALEIGFERLFV